ncbi:PKD-like family lipoprotein [Parapedobacter deserti]|uniref:PKD-like family lipoprotein n=1 Tax=Parapedobacter deserti TaxID=1912957 RepID=A0ABV7JP86_9SPHI
MKKFVIALSILSILSVSCYKDKGNYDINMPVAPEVTNLLETYGAIVGDSLIIEPEIIAPADADIELEWRIGVPEADSSIEQVGPSLRMVFGLQANRYHALLTIHNKANGMRYFHRFYIQGVTEFVSGMTVLSVENGVTQLSFIKPDSTVQSRLYEAINGKQLPANPRHLLYMTNQTTGGTPLGYWIITQNGGVRLNVTTMQEDPVYPNTLATNFFLPPPTIEVGHMVQHPQGVMMGVINGRFYGGTTHTWDQAATYGMFGSYADGDYNLAPKFVMANVNGQYSFIAFDRIKRQFLRFNLYGVPTYFGTQYTVTNTGIFDPTNVGMDLVDIVQSNNTETYAYVRGADGTIRELAFTVNFNGPFTFTPGHNRLFVRQNLFGENTKLLAAQNGVIYIASGNKVYRYNPLNEDIRELETSFDTPITMMKFHNGQNTLVVGSGSSLYFLAIQTGRFGDLTGQIDGIPGYPVDVAFRNF